MPMAGADEWGLKKTRGGAGRTVACGGPFYHTENPWRGQNLQEKVYFYL